MFGFLKSVVLVPVFNKLSSINKKEFKETLKKIQGLL